MRVELDSVLIDSRCVYLCPIGHRALFELVCRFYTALDVAYGRLVSSVEGSVCEMYYRDDGYFQDVYFEGSHLQGAYLRYRGEVYWVPHRILHRAGYLS